MGTLGPSPSPSAPRPRPTSPNPMGGAELFLPPLLSSLSPPAFLPPSQPPSFLPAHPLQLRAHGPPPAAPAPGNPAASAAGSAAHPGSGSWVPSWGRQPAAAPSSAHPRPRRLNIVLLSVCSRLSLKSGRFPAFLSHPAQFFTSPPCWHPLPVTLFTHFFIFSFRPLPPFTDFSTFHSISLRFRPSLCLYSPPPVSPKAYDLAPRGPG